MKTKLNEWENFEKCSFRLKGILLKFHYMIEHYGGVFYIEDIKTNDLGLSYKTYEELKKLL